MTSTPIPAPSVDELNAADAALIAAACDGDSRLFGRRAMPVTDLQRAAARIVFRDTWQRLRETVVPAWQNFVAALRSAGWAEQEPTQAQFTLAPGPAVRDPE